MQKIWVVRFRLELTARQLLFSVHCSGTISQLVTVGLVTTAFKHVNCSYCNICKAFSLCTVICISVISICAYVNSKGFVSG